jgi:hypothetical protein
MRITNQCFVCLSSWLRQNGRNKVPHPLIGSAPYGKFKPVTVYELPKNWIVCKNYLTVQSNTWRAFLKTWNQMKTMVCCGFSLTGRANKPEEIWKKCTKKEWIMYAPEVPFTCSPWFDITVIPSWLKHQWCQLHIWISPLMRLNL